MSRKKDVRSTGPLSALTGRLSALNSALSMHGGGEFLRFDRVVHIFEAAVPFKGRQNFAPRCDSRMADLSAPLEIAHGHFPAPRPKASD